MGGGAEHRHTVWGEGLSIGIQYGGGGGAQHRHTVWGGLSIGIQYGGRGRGSA